MGADSLHGTDVGTKHQKNANDMFGLGVSIGVREVVICPLFEENKLPIFVPSNGQNKRP